MTILTREEVVALVLMGHGSTLGDSKKVMEELGKKIERRKIFKTVRIALMEFNSPSIAETLRNLAKEGIKSIVALPVMLAGGTHVKRDVPEMLKAAFEEKWKEMGGKLIYGNQLGADERVADILVDRAKEAIEEPALTLSLPSKK